MSKAPRKLAIFSRNSFEQHSWSINFCWATQLLNKLLLHATLPKHVINKIQLQAIVFHYQLSNCVALDQTGSSRAIFCAIPIHFHSTIPNQWSSNHLWRRGNIPGKKLSESNCSCNICVAQAISVLLKPFFCSSNSKKCVINTKFIEQLCCSIVLLEKICQCTRGLIRERQ